MKLFPMRTRKQREAQTVEIMIRQFCKDHHGAKGALCPNCQEMLLYARQRLHHCSFQEDKPTCGKCPIHCYAPAKREKIKEIMRYAGPRMFLRHPILAINHLLIALSDRNRF